MNMYLKYNEINTRITMNIEFSNKYLFFQYKLNKIKIYI